MMANEDNFAFDELGIPLTEVGEKLHLINETLKDYGILLRRDIGANVEISEVKGEDLATGITITASLFARKEKQKK
jgi:hypothetical protein